MTTRPSIGPPTPQTPDQTAAQPHSPILLRPVLTTSYMRTALRRSGHDGLSKPRVLDSRPIHTYKLLCRNGLLSKDRPAKVANHADMTQLTG